VVIAKSKQHIYVCDSVFKPIGHEDIDVNHHWLQ